MIRKEILNDNTFGANYDENLLSLYPAGTFSNKKFIILTKEQVEILDSDTSRYYYCEDALGIFNGNPFGVIEVPRYDEKLLLRTKDAKKRQIISLYNYAKTHYLLNISSEFYVLLGWINTWEILLSRAEKNKTSEINNVRVYRKTPNSQFEGEHISIPISKFRSYLDSMKRTKFLVLQSKKDRYMKILNASETISDIKSIKINYGYMMEE